MIRPTPTLHGRTDVLDVSPYTGRNPLYQDGPLRVSGNRRYLEHSDGTPFFWLRDTWWMGLCRYARVNPLYFDMADIRIQYLVERGLVPCIVRCWGYYLPILGEERMKKHWRYLVARWGAYPVVWCLAGEGSMPYYLSTTKDADAARQKKGGPRSQGTSTGWIPIADW